MINSPEITPEEKACFKRNGFSSPFGTYHERACSIVVVIAYSYWSSMARPQYGVYMTHGTPGGEFWRNTDPLRTFNTESDAREFAEKLYGIAGSGKLATLVDYKL